MEIDEQWELQDQLDDVREVLNQLEEKLKRSTPRGEYDHNVDQALSKYKDSIKKSEEQKKKEYITALTKATEEYEQAKYAAEDLADETYRRAEEEAKMQYEESVDEARKKFYRKSE